MTALREKAGGDFCPMFREVDHFTCAEGGVFEVCDGLADRRVDNPNGETASLQEYRTRIEAAAYFAGRPSFFSKNFFRWLRA